MASSSRTTLRRRLGVLIAGAAVVTSLTAATAAAAPPGPLAAPAAGPTRPAADPPSPATGTPPRGFLLDRGRFKPVTLPPDLQHIAALDLGPVDLNDRRQIVGSYDDVAADATRGFLLDRGRFTMVHVPGAMSSQAQGINNRGQIVGLVGNP
jgi:hypothetical protein